MPWETVEMHEVVLSQVFQFADEFQDGTFKALASRSAVLAAPTCHRLFESFRTFYCPNVLFSDRSEEVEADFATAFDTDLRRRFEDLTRVETPEGVARLLQDELGTGEGSMLTVLRLLLVNFLASQVSSCGKVYNGEPSGGKSQLKGCDHFFNLIKCPQSFCFPLLQREITFISDLSSSGYLRLAADVIIELNRKYQSLFGCADEELLFEALRTCIQKLCSKAIVAGTGEVPAPMTPYLLCTRVRELFEKGLNEPGFLPECVGQMIRMLLHKAGFETQRVLQDTRVMSTCTHMVIGTQFHLHAEDVSLKYLTSEGSHFEDMEKKATDLLFWMSSSSNGCHMVNGWIREALCVTLFNVMLGFYGEGGFLSSHQLVESKFLLFILQAEEAGPTIRQHALLILALTAFEKLLEELQLGGRRLVW